VAAAGRRHVEERRETGADPFAGHDAIGPGADLRGRLHQLHAAVGQIARTGTDAQRAAAAGVLADARRSIYLLLADGPDTPDSGPAGGDA